VTSSFMIFAAGGKTYAVNLQEVSGVVESPSFFPIPMAPLYFAGGINLHGSVIPVADISAYRGGEPSTGGPVVILDRGEGNLGIRVEKIVDMLVGEEEDAEGDNPAPDRVPQAVEESDLLSVAEMITEIELRLAQGGA
jgi:chemotaxis signal transduction protein